MTDSIDVVLLGTGSPLPSPVRCGAGQVVEAGGARVLVDCGWGAARRLYGARIPPPSIGAVCFTHLHSDHITDLPDFLISRWTGGATTPLAVYGPAGTRAMVEGFLAALAADIGYRRAHHGDKLDPNGARCEVHELAATPEPAPAVTLGPLTVESFAVDHAPVAPALGYRFAAGDVRVVISGDTTACETLRQAARDADLLVCEALNTAMLQQRIELLRGMGQARVAGLLDDVAGYHAATLDVAALARDAGVRRLVLSHIVPPIGEEPEQAAAFAAGMAAIYSGEIVVGRDLDRFTVTAPA